MERLVVALLGRLVMVTVLLEVVTLVMVMEAVHVECCTSLLQ